MVTPEWYLILSAILFVIGLAGFMTRSGALMMFMSIELMLNAVNLTFVAGGTLTGNLQGQVGVFFVLVVAAAEVVVGLAIVMLVFRRRETANVDDLSEMKG